MIVIVGGLAWREGDQPAPAGRACDIALAAAALGARVEVVGRAGDDPTGDAVMLGLARAGIGHVAVLRDPSRPTPLIEVPAEPTTSADEDRPEHTPAISGPALEAADVSLGLQYLTAFGSSIVTDDVPSAAVVVAIESAEFTGAHLILLTAADDDPPELSRERRRSWRCRTWQTTARSPGWSARTPPASIGGSEPGRAFAEAVDAAGWEALDPRDA